MTMANGLTGRHVLGSLLGVAGRGPVGLVYADAHSDFVTADRSTTGSAAARCLALAVGRGEGPLAALGGASPLVRGADVALLGRRDHADAPYYGQDAFEEYGLLDLDQPPRVLYQVQPVVDGKLRKKLPASVSVVFLVDPSGRVDKPRVQTSSDAAFEVAALAAVKQWRFEPGKRSGKPVAFRMRVPFTFPQGS